MPRLALSPPCIFHHQSLSNTMEILRRQCTRAASTIFVFLSNPPCAPRVSSQRKTDRVTLVSENPNCEYPWLMRRAPPTQQSVGQSPHNALQTRLCCQRHRFLSMQYRDCQDTDTFLLWNLMWESTTLCVGNVQPFFSLLTMRHTNDRVTFWYGSYEV